MSTINMQVAKTILEQLGGNRFIAMTGAKDFVATDDNTVVFKIPRNASKANHVRITLDPSDTYTVTFSQYRMLKTSGLKVTEIHKTEGVYCDMLRDLFTQVTGMYTSL